MINFLGNFCTCKKTKLGVGSIVPKMVIDIIAMRSHAGNKRLQGILSKIIGMQKENNFIDSILKKEGRKMHSNNKH